MNVKVVLIDNGSPVALSDGASFIYNLLPVGRFYDKRYGEVWINDKKLNEMARNFGKYPSYEVPVKLGHGDGAPSPGKVIAIQAKPEGLEITMQVDADTAQAINKKYYRYMSAEFDENYMDKESGEYVGAVLLGAALVNQPASPYMDPLVLADDINLKGGTETMTMEEMQRQLSDIKTEFQKRDDAARKEFSDKIAAEQAKVETEQAKNAELEKKLAEAEVQRKELAEREAKAQKEQHEAEVKSFCDGWVSKGIPPAVLEKAKPVLLAESRVIKLSDTEETSLMKLLGDIFELMPKVPMGLVGKPDGEGSTQLSDIDEARKRGKAMAEAVNKKGA